MSPSHRPVLDSGGVCSMGPNLIYCKDWVSTRDLKILCNFFWTGL